VFKRALVVACLAVIHAVLASSAFADDEFQLAIPSQPVADAVKTLSYQTKHSVLFQADQLGDTHTQAIDGIFSLKEALNLLLQGTGLKGGLTDSGVIVVSLNKSANAPNREESMPDLSIQKTKRSLLASISALLFGASGATGLHAVDTADDAAFTLEEIVVVARKRSESLQTVPIAITAVTSETIANIAASDLSDISLISTSANIDSDGFVTIRGVGDFARNIGAGARAAVYIDGVLAGRSYAFNQNLLDVERVEILRGPQGTLFGKNSVSGAINIITKKPHNEFEGHVAAEYGNLNHTQLEANINAPLVEDKLFFSVQGSYLYEDGYIQNTLLDRDLNGRDRYSIRAKMLFQASDNTEIILSGDYLEESVHYTDYLAQPGAAFGGNAEAPDVFEARHDTDEANDFGYKGGSLTINHDFDNEYTLTSITAYRENSFEFTAEEDFSSVDGASSLFNEASDQFSQEIRLSSPAGDTFDYVIGAYYLDQTFVTSRGATLGAALGGPIPIVTPGEVSDKSLSGFVHANYRPTEFLELSAGLRYTHQEKELLYSSSDPSGAFFLNFTDFTDDRTDNVLSPKFSVKYTLNDTTNVYTTFSKAFKSGGWNADFITTLDQIAFAPEHATNYEAGLKTTTLEGRLRLNVALFLTKFKDFQVRRFVQIPGEGTINVIDNAGAVTSKGFEVEASVLLSQTLALTANYTYNDAYYNEYRDAEGVGVHFDGNDLGLTPKHNAYVALDYDADINADFSLKVHADYNYRGSQFTDAGNTVLGEVGNRSLFNARIALFHEASGVELSVWAKNIFDKTVLGGISTSFLGVMRALPEKPRTVGVKVKYNF